MTSILSHFFFQEKRREEKKTFLPVCLGITSFELRGMWLKQPQPVVVFKHLNSITSISLSILAYLTLASLPSCNNVAPSPT